MSPYDFPHLETLVKKIVHDKQPFERLEMKKEDLLKMFEVCDCCTFLGYVACHAVAIHYRLHHHHCHVANQVCHVIASQYLWHIACLHRSPVELLELSLSW